MKIWALILALLLTGCATKSEPVVTDTFCITAVKRKWSINDRLEVINEASVWNRAIDKRCGIGRPSA